jgi:glyoxalase family protein
MESAILGLHHVTATADDAQADVDFFGDSLGLRLVKKTVNFDNHSVYHFYYGDERGTPGTIWTTFPYKGHGVRIGTKGAGQITATSFSVPAGSLGVWRQRFADAGLRAQELPARFGDEVVRVLDPSGLVIELVANSKDTRAPWTGAGVDSPAAVRGLHSVTMTIVTPADTVEFMRRLLGYEVVGEQSSDSRTRLAVRGDEPGKTIDIVRATDGPHAINGLGTVHHVAMAVATEEDQLRLRRELLHAGARVTDVLDRQYFKSIYFREPGGVLFEIATVKPGFLVDEPLGELGRSLKLPPWEEPARAQIERGLAPLRPR